MLTRIFRRTLLLLCLMTSFSGILARMPQSVVGDTPRTYWQFLFLYERTTAPGQEEVIFRPILPLYSSYNNYEKAYNASNVLYPLFYYNGTNHWYRWSGLLDLFTGDSFHHDDTADDTDLMITPLFHWGGGGDANERYYSFFPLFGHIRDKFGWSEINYVLFPIYANWSYKGYKAHGVLWPLIMWGSGPDREDLRIIPFYSSKIHKDKYIHKSILWPILQWGYDDLDKKEPRGYFLFFPFYARKWSADGNLSAHSILWPTSLVAWGGDKVTNSFEFKAFWFLYQYGYSDEPVMRKHILFPLFGYYRFADREFTFITPFWSNLKTHSTVVESDYDILFPFYWNLTRSFRKERSNEKYIKIWPFFHYKYDNSGNLGFQVLSLWPFRSEGAERYWGPLWSLAEYREFENGDRYFALFLRLYAQYWNENEFHLFLLGFEFHNTPRYWSFEFLGGMLGFRRDFPLQQEPQSTVRFFWVNL